MCGNLFYTGPGKEGWVSYKLQIKGLTASQVVRLIGLLLVSAIQKIVHNVRNGMAESIVRLRKNQRQSDLARHVECKGPP